MDPKIGQVWEWVIDREHISVFSVIIPSAHEIEVLCEVLEGKDVGSTFQTSIGNFKSPAWIKEYDTVEEYHLDSD